MRVVAGIAAGIAGALVMIWVIGGPGAVAMASFARALEPSPLVFLAAVVAFGVTLLLSWSRSALISGAVVLSLLALLVNLRLFGFGFVPPNILTNAGIQPAIYVLIGTWTCLALRRRGGRPSHRSARGTTPALRQQSPPPGEQRSVS